MKYMKYNVHAMNIVSQQICFQILLCYAKGSTVAVRKKAVFPETPLQSNQSLNPDRKLYIWNRDWNILEEQCI